MWMIYICFNLNMFRAFFFNNILSVSKNIEQLFINFRGFCGDNFQFDFLAFAETMLDSSIEQLYRMPQFKIINLNSI